MKLHIYHYNFIYYINLPQKNLTILIKIQKYSVTLSLSFLKNRLIFLAFFYPIDLEW